MGLRGEVTYREIFTMLPKMDACDLMLYKQNRSDTNTVIMGLNFQSDSFSFSAHLVTGNTIQTIEITSPFDGPILENMISKIKAHLA